jgi:hypothetical protein
MKLKRRKDPDYSYIEGMISPVTPLEDGVKAVIYGRQGSGKTTLGATFPKPLLIVDISEKGTDSVWDVKGIKVIKPKTWEQFVDTYWYVREGKKFKSAMIDTVSNLQDLAIRDVKEVSEDEKVTGNWGTMTKRDWGKVSGMLKNEILNWRDLPGMNVLFIAHDRVFNVDDEDDTEGMISPEVGPRLMPSVASTMNAAVGIIGNCFIREKVKEVKVGKTKLIKRDVQYCMRVGPHAYYVTKIRKPKGIVVPKVIVDPTYELLVKTIRGELKGDE